MKCCDFIDLTVHKSAAAHELRNVEQVEPLTLPMASVWCCVQICNRLTQCCLSLASVAEREGGGSGSRVSEQPGNGHTRGASRSIPRAPPSADNGERADQYETKLMGGDDSRLKRQSVETRTRKKRCWFGGDCSSRHRAACPRIKMLSNIVPFVSTWNCDKTFIQ